MKKRETVAEKRKQRPHRDRVWPQETSSCSASTSSFASSSSYFFCRRLFIVLQFVVCGTVYCILPSADKVIIGKVVRDFYAIKQRGFSRSLSLSLSLLGLGNSCLFLISEPSTYIMPVIARHNKPANYLSGCAYALFIVILSRQFNKRRDETR